ncbi:MAG: hypothetical protein R3F29_12535 [Planctomycetota bacterium]
MSLLQALHDSAARAGMNLVGLVDARRFDRCQPCESRVASLRPACGSVVVLGTGGASFWKVVEQQGAVGAPSVERVEELAANSVRQVAAELEAKGVGCRAMLAQGGRLDLTCLAETAGLGIVSPVSGMLLHPKYGPWLRVRGVVLVDGHPFGEIPDASISEQFRPCCTCHQPCVSACPPKVHEFGGHADRQRCAEHRHGGGCATGCCSRSACPVGAEHGAGVGALLHAHSSGIRMLRRKFGLGLWRMVPGFLRQPGR